ncbi:hypothetical protein JRO89_XS01G0103500 [Xanthoceras sorbifolium]|uniref:Uncharacterized protein n=1 Tax=Xanthoceras sorbifolium TaxID=99658 RepID=A0ABQ8IJ94_9ROSI|nr:hypothetical protein JRO89_XS01G0103500 [Xanthoceras sorbifolium]
MIPSLYYNMPLKDAFSLGLIRSGRGLFDILYFYCVISKEAFSTIVMITIFQAVATAPVLRATYDTSRRYMAYNRRIIQHSKLQSVQIVGAFRVWKMNSTSCWLEEDMTKDKFILEAVQQSYTFKNCKLQKLKSEDKKTIPCKEFL